MDQLESGICLSSRLSSQQLLPTLKIRSTIFFKAQDKESTLCFDSHNQSQSFEYTRGIQHSIEKIETAQLELQSKFKKVIESLVKEIAIKQEANSLLENEIAGLNEQLKESKKDINIIAAYLARQKQKGKQNESRHAILNSAKLNGNLEKSISGSKGPINISDKVMYLKEKNISKHTLITKKTYKI